MASLLSIADVTAEQIVAILDHAKRFYDAGDEPTQKYTTLRGRTAVLLFFENSTRTRTSFELAAKRLSAETINISGASSSVTKGETLLDTARNIAAMHCDALVVRHAFAGAAAMLSQAVDCAVINAGDGQHEHPTQALLDTATIRAHKGAISGLEVAIVGDIAHSRVARSNVLCLTKLGARVRLIAPHTLMPRAVELIGGEATRDRVTLFSRLEDGLEGADVVMMLRVQNERHAGDAPRFPNTREFSRTFGLSSATLSVTKPDAIVMHPGPINRGVELAPEIADGPRAVILDQVAWGVAIRMAVLERAVGAS